MGGRPHAAVPVLGLVVFLSALAVQRISELVHSARNVARLRARGAREFAPGHFPLLVLVHILLPVSVVADVLVLGARPGSAWPIWLGFVLAAQALRVSAVWALGERWTVGIWVIPGAPRVARGPYRFMSHPNYLAVVVELFAMPMMFGAWRTAIAVSALNAVALGIRIRAEERALRSTKASGG